jgi:hypothetical protein
VIATLLHFGWDTDVTLCGTDGPVLLGGTADNLPEHVRLASAEQAEHRVYVLCGGCATKVRAKAEADADVADIEAAVEGMLATLLDSLAGGGRHSA